MVSHINYSIKLGGVQTQVELLEKVSYIYTR